VDPVFPLLYIKKFNYHFLHYHQLKLLLE